MTPSVVNCNNNNNNNNNNNTFDFDKCAIINSTKIEVQNQQCKYKDIYEQQPEETYKYIGIPQNQQADHSRLKNIFTEK